MYEATEIRYPILMADIIDSRRITSSHLIDDFRQLVNYINENWTSVITSPQPLHRAMSFRPL